MSTPSPRTVLAELRREGVVIEPSGDRLHIESPRGILTQEWKETLKALKLDLLAALATEERVLDMSLADFRTGGHAIEVRVPWLAETLWFVPRVEHVEVLMREGVARGRVWTARELIDLASIDGVTPADIERIGRLKAKFGAQVVSVSPDDHVDP